jgi:hypothetical protein
LATSSVVCLAVYILSQFAVDVMLIRFFSTPPFRAHKLLRSTAYESPGSGRSRDALKVDIDKIGIGRKSSMNVPEGLRNSTTATEMNLWEAADEERGPKEVTSAYS